MNLIQREDVVMLAPENTTGVELGVAEGVFSERVLKKKHLSHLYSIDMYADDRGHDIEQYKRAFLRFKPYQKFSTILKMRFDQAVDLFEDNSLGFVYVDGYAHTGQENGKTLEQWYPKVMSGGVFAGDDYHLHHPNTIKIVDEFAKNHNLKLLIIDCHEPYSIWSEYPTWYVIKP